MPQHRPQGKLPQGIRPKPGKGKGPARNPQRQQTKQLLGAQYGTKGSSKVFGAALGGFGGALLGGPAGAAAGMAIGGAAGHYLSEITGLGDYKVRRNIFAPGTTIPTIVNANKRKGCLVVRHKEFLGDIVSDPKPGVFKIQSFAINPGIEKSFPFLAQIAANYEEYSIQGLVFEYRSTSADALNSVNTALGSVIMATSYNVSNPPFESKAEMDSYQFTTSCRPSTSALHLVECDPGQSVLSELYVRAYDVPPNTDPRFYDLGNFQIATSGLQGASVTVGELWISYQVALLKPKLFDALGNGNGFAHYNAPVGISNALPFGPAGSLVKTANSSMTLVQNPLAPSVITLPFSPEPQTYVFLACYRGGAAVITPPVFTGGGGLTVVTTAAKSYLFPLDSDENFPSAGANSTTYTFMSYLLVPGNTLAPTISAGAAGILPVASIADIKLIQIPNGFY